MEQLSIPYRIALVALVVIAPLYFLVLKPKSDPGAPVAATPAAPAAVAPAAESAKGPTAPGMKGLNTAIDKAKGAVATQASSDAATQAATGGRVAGPVASTAAAKPAAVKPAAAKPAAAPAPAAARATAAAPAATPATPAKPATSGDPSAPILAAVDRGHTEVVLFAGTKASDDRAVRAAVRRIGRHGGTVDVHVVPIGRVGDYEAITRGVTVQQAPTVLVIGRKKAARTLVGFTTTAELNQLVGDVRHSG